MPHKSKSKSKPSKASAAKPSKAASPPLPPVEEVKAKARKFINSYHLPIPFEDALCYCFALNPPDILEKIVIPAIQIETPVLGLRTFGSFVPVHSNEMFQLFCNNLEPSFPLFKEIKIRTGNFRVVEKLGRRSYKLEHKALTMFAKFEHHKRHKTEGATIWVSNFFLNAWNFIYILFGFSA